MARKPSLWFRKQTGCYYTTLNGKKVRLGTDKKEAQKAFHALMAQSEPEPVTVRMSFRKLADLYLAYTKAAKDEKTFKHQLYFLKSFTARVKGKAVLDLKPGDVTQWLLAQPTWGHNSQVTARGILRSCLNWGIGEGYIQVNPLARMKTGSFHRKERMLTREEREKIKAAVTDKTFLRFLIFLEQTGARPFSEAAQVTADLIDWREGSITLERHKNARKGKTRVVYLSPVLKELLTEMVAERPKGPLFTTKNGVPYNKSNIIGRVRVLERKLGMERWNFYSFRHAFLSEGLAKGITADVLAELCGNTPKTITKYYSHLDKMKDALREAARRATA